MGKIWIILGVRKSLQEGVFFVVVVVFNLKYKFKDGGCWD